MREIVELIDSLSPSEKQHFKKKHNPNSDFILLFDYLNKNESYEYADVAKYLQKKHKSEKVFSSSYLSVLKSYLKNRILESLRLQYIRKRKNYEFISKSMNTDILLEKGLYGLARSELESVSKDIKEFSFPIEKLLLNRRKSFLDFYENYQWSTLEDIDRLYNSRVDSAEQLLLEIKYARVIAVMSFHYFKGEQNEEMLDELMREPYMQDNSLCTDFSTRYLFHWVHAQFQELKNNRKGAQEHFVEAVKIWLDNPAYIDVHPKMYLSTCYTYFKYLIQQKDPFSDILGDINFDVLMAKVKSEHLTLGQKQNHVFIFNLFQIIYLRYQEKYEEIVDFVGDPLMVNNLVNGLRYFDRVIYCYYCALAYYEEGRLDMGIDILSDLISPIDHRISNNPLFTRVYILLYLLILYEKDDLKYLRLQISKCKKYFQEENKLSRFEEQFITMLSQLSSNRYKSDPEAVYRRFGERLAIEYKNQDQGIEKEYRYFLTWVQKRMIEI